MALTINTNLGSLVVQKNLQEATKSLNKSIERMTTGFRINSAGDDAAGYAVATKMNTQLSSVSVAQDNVAIGASMLSTSEKNSDLIIAHLQRIRDLAEEAANGTYGDDSRAAIKAEVEARADEIDRIANSADFNGIRLFKDSGTAITLQVGTTSGSESQITLTAGLFAKATISSLSSKKGSDLGTAMMSAENAKGAITNIDTAIATMTARQTKIGAALNRLDSAADALDVQYANITSSLSTVRDADVAKESSAFVSAQILQQASASLLATANQSPSIALNLI